MKMNNKNLLVLMTLLIFEGVTGCNSNNSNSHLISIQKKNVIQKKKKIKNKIEFGDSLFVQRIIDGFFFQEKISKEQDYALVVKHCFSHTDEQYDETFADGLSQMLIKYPEKIKGIQKAISSLPAEQQNKANYNMMVYIVSSWIMENYTDTMDLNVFYQTYPFFKRSSKIDNILKEQFENSME